MTGGTLTIWCIACAWGLERSLHVALFDHTEIFIGEAPALYELYAALPMEPDLEYQLTRALYFDARRDDYSVAHIRSESVFVFGLVATEDEFTRALNQRRDELETSRLGERAAAYSDPLSMLPSIVPPSDILTYFTRFASHSPINSVSPATGSAAFLLKSMRSLQAWTIQDATAPTLFTESDAHA